MWQTAALWPIMAFLANVRVMNAASVAVDVTDVSAVLGNDVPMPRLFSEEAAQVLDNYGRTSQPGREGFHRSAGPATPPESQLVGDPLEVKGVNAGARQRQLTEKISRRVMKWRPEEILRNSAIIALSNAGEEFAGSDEDVLSTLLNNTSDDWDPTSISDEDERNYDDLWRGFLKEPENDVPKFKARFVILKTTGPGKFEQVDIQPENFLEQMNNIGFDWKAPTKMIIHGFLETGDETWIWDVGKALKNAENCNVIVVDWHEGSSLLYYDVVRNSRSIGHRIARFLNGIKEYHRDFSMENVHLIGHSVGAHACGFVGQAVAPLRIGRITGLDPAGFMFSIAPRELRLDSSDALLVDVIHTNAAPIYELGQGIPEPCGHVDIYVNGGQKQPGCAVSAIPLETWIGVGKSDGFQGILDKLGCHHERAHEYYLESINSTCPMVAYECESYEDFLSGECLDCGVNGRRCAPTGYQLKQFDTSRNMGHGSVIMFTTTNTQAPFCRYHYSVQVETAPDIQKSAAFGYLHAEIDATHGKFPYKHLTKSRSKKFKPGKKYEFLITAQDNIGDIQRVKLRWGHDDSYYSSMLCVIEENLNKCKNYLQLDQVTVIGPATAASSDQPRLPTNQTGLIKRYCWRKPQPQTLKNGLWRTFELNPC